jgi:hypothetical protein
VVAALGAGAAAAEPLTLPSPIGLVQPPPPLPAGATSLESEQELRFPGHLRNDQRVVVGLREDGSAGSVEATQRLAIRHVGDFSFVIPAPVLSVVAAPGSQAEPGQRNTGIVWQGFSSGRRVLGARAMLEPLAAERGLPLEVKIERRGDRSVVRLTDVARRRLQVTGGSASAAKLGPILARVAAGLAAPDRVDLSRALIVDGSPKGAASLDVDLPLRVRGTITQPGGPPVRVSTLLGNGRPLSRTVVVRGTAPKISLSVEPLRSKELLPTRAELGRAQDPLRLMQMALARMGLSNQYSQFLATPDPLGVNRASYVYSTAAAPPTPQVTRSEGGGSDTLAIALGATLGAAALVGLAVLWARS